MSVKSYGVCKHSNNLTNYFLNNSFYEVLNTNEVFTLDLDGAAHTIGERMSTAASPLHLA